MNYEKKWNKHFTEILDLHELVKYHDQMIDSGKWKSVRNEKAKEGEEWVNGKWLTYAKTKEFLLTRSSPDFIQKACRDMLAKMQDMPEVKAMSQTAIGKKRRIYGDEWDELNIDRLMSGQDHWQKRRKVERRLVKIYVNIWLSCMNNVEDFASMAAGEYCAVELLEKMWYSVEVWWCINGKIGGWFFGSGWEKNLATFLVKRASDLGTLEQISCLGMPWIFRHYLFNYMHNLAGEHNGQCIVQQDLYDDKKITNTIDKAWDNSKGWMQQFYKWLNKISFE